MELKVSPVNGTDKEAVRAIYTDSFLKEDRMPFFLMRAMGKLWNTELLSCYDKNTLCGFLYLAKTRKLVFVMFFAVVPAMRAAGYGSQILRTIQDRYSNHKIIITIEPCDGGAEDIETRIRRKKFYLKNGYTETGYRMKLGKEQEILIKNGLFHKEEFLFFFLRYSMLTTIPRIWRADV